RRTTSTWRVPVQTKLSFMDDVAIPQISMWDQWDEEQKRVVIEMLARLISKMIVAKQQSGAQQGRIAKSNLRTSGVPQWAIFANPPPRRSSITASRRRGSMHWFNARVTWVGPKSR